MTKIVWDQIGDRLYETGLDRGVLYLSDQSGIPWNGLLSVQEDLSEEVSTPFYFDGIKNIDSPGFGDFAATINAVTYPDEFLEYEGISELDSGLSVGNQGNKTFGLAYRTLIGNDVDGIDHGYKIHILYNLRAIPDTTSYKTLGANPTPIEFGWAITSRPERIPGYRPTAHAIIDSRFLDSDLLTVVEGLLYGTDTTSPYLPSLGAFTSFFSFYFSFVDNGDGTWTATVPDWLVTMIDSTTFQIVGVDATYLDADTYQMETT